MTIKEMFVWRVLALFALAAVAARPTCEEFTNCWACSASPLCAWCGSAARCQLYSNTSACPFTLWKGTCCRTVTPQGCEACIRQAGCGYCLDQGCFEGSPSGPASSSCAAWFFETCYDPGIVISFSGTSVIFGLTATIGGGLVFACVSVLFFFVRRLYLRWQAARQFDAYLKTHRNSCSVCEDMVATLRCRRCAQVLCAACGEESSCKRGGGGGSGSGRGGGGGGGGGGGDARRHVVEDIQLGSKSAPGNDEHYESFARLRATRNLNFDDMD